MNTSTQDITRHVIRISRYFKLEFLAIYKHYSVQNYNKTYENIFTYILKLYVIWSLPRFFILA